MAWVIPKDPNGNTTEVDKLHIEFTKVFCSTFPWEDVSSDILLKLDAPSWGMNKLSVEYLFDEKYSDLEFNMSNEFKLKWRRKTISFASFC